MVIGIGNPDRGDDGVGPRVVDALAGCLPRGVELITRSGDMLALVEEWTDAAVAICIDAAAPMGTPGRIHRIDAAAETLLPPPGTTSSHAMGLSEAIGLARALGTVPARIVVFAVEGEQFETGAPLSAAVATAIPEVAAQVLAEVARLAARAPADA